jgi:hypothetical protein
MFLKSTNNFLATLSESQTINSIKKDFSFNKYIEVDDSYLNVDIDTLIQTYI